MSHESLPSDSDGEIGGEPFQPEPNDFDLWESELAGNERVAEYSEQLGRIAMMDVIGMEIDPEILLLTQLENQTEPIREPEKKQKPEPHEANHITPERHSGDNYLLSDDMFQAAMGLIYFTSGVPADEMYG